jgi:hypothetical protein
VPTVSSGTLFYRQGVPAVTACWLCATQVAVGAAFKRMNSALWLPDSVKGVALLAAVAGTPGGEM